MDYVVIAAAVIPASIASIVAPYVSVKLTVPATAREFYKQRWWERKAEEYSQLLANFAELHHVYGIWWDEQMMGQRLSKAYRDKLSDRSLQARDALIKVRSTGTFIVSDPVAADLEMLVRELEKEDPHGDYVSDLGRQVAAIGECISRVREHAKSDLDSVKQ